MKVAHKSLLAVTALLGLGAIQASAQSNPQNYAGNGAGGFGSVIGGGSLNFSSNGTTLTGTITLGGTSGFNDDLVIYISTGKAGGFTSTSSFTDNGGGNDELREATSGLSADGNTRATVNFSAGFAANFAFALSPAKAQFGSFYTLNNAGNFTYGSDGTNGNANLTPTGTNGVVTDGNGNFVRNQTFTFSIALALLGNATSFNFETTYLNGHDAYRSNEAFGNTVLDASNSGNPAASNGSAMYNLGSDTASLGNYSTWSTVPEPSTWVAGVLMGGVLLCTLHARRRGRSASSAR